MNQIAGKLGTARINCTCPPTAEDCTCGATKLNFSSWSVGPFDDIDNDNFESYRELGIEPITIELSGEWWGPQWVRLNKQLERVPPGKDTPGYGYIVPVEFVRPLQMCHARLMRQDRKRRRRYEHQKRKQ